MSRFNRCPDCGAVPSGGLLKGAYFKISRAKRKLLIMIAGQKI